MTSYLAYILLLLIINNTKGNMLLNINTFEYKYENFSQLLYYGKELKFVIASTKNYLLKFSADNLSKPIELRQTGPVNDSVLCMKPNVCSMSLCTADLKSQNKCQPKPTDVYVKSWTTTDTQLIVCYNVYQGYCETIDLYSKFISDAQGRGYSIVTYDLNSHSTILYFENKLYTAIEINYSLNYLTHDFSILSIRTLPNLDLVKEEDNVFNVLHGILGRGYDIIFPLEFKGSFHITDNREEAAAPNYIFFLLNQPENKIDPKNGKFQVRLARICSSDDYFSSFIDIGLNCGDPDIQTYYQVDSWHLANVGKNLSKWYRNITRFKGLSAEKNANFDQILFINFKVIKITMNYLETLQRFVTCAYPMAEIMELLDVVKKNCQKGYGSINERPFDVQSNDKPCMKAYFQDTLKGLCDNKARNKHIIGDHYGENSGKGHEIIIKDGLRASSLNVFPVNEEYTVAVIGGSNGRIYKYELFENRYRELVVHSVFESKILDIKLVENKTIAFAISNSKLAVIDFAQCHKVTTCQACLHLSPFCGWCVTNGRCSLKNYCKSPFWIPYERDISNNMCPEIKNLMSHNIIEYLSDKRPVFKFEIYKVPGVILKGNKDRLVCAYYFSGDVLIDKVSANYISDSLITCNSIMRDHIPPIPSNYNFISIKLKVFINDSFLVESVFYIYDCSRSNTCSKCTENRFACSWCILDNKCVATAQNSCTQRYIIESKMSHQCPTFEFLSKTVAFPDGSPVEIDLKVKNFDDYQNMQVEFLCIESCGNSTVKAYSIKDVLKCQFREIKISSKKTVNCTVNVIWKLKNSNTGYLENTNTFSFQIYNCTRLSEHCDDCLFLTQEYGCGFCIRSNKCVIKSDCVMPDDRWINRRDQYCPSPIINEIIPANSTLMSESVILVKGRNLGFEKNDLLLSISLENNLRVLQCTFIEESYISSKQFKCRINKAIDNFPTPVTFEFVYRSSRSSHLAKKEFTFYTPVIDKIEPNQGPFMGGTIITVSGLYLNVGSKKAVVLVHQNVKTDCEIIENYGSMLFCRIKDFTKYTSLIRRKRNSIKSDTKAFISITVDSMTFNYSKVLYFFFPNPTDIKVSRDRFLPNGGQMIQVSGINIHRIDKPYLSFKCNGILSSPSKCRHRNETIICLTPKILSFKTLTDCELRLSMEKTVLLHKTKVTVFPMPKFVNISEKKTLPLTSWSFIEKKTKVDNLIQFKFDAKEQIHFSAFDLKELNISIGQLSCQHIVVSSKFIECSLLPKDVNTYRKYPVTINIGQTFQISLGQTQFIKGDISLDNASLVIIVVLIIVVFTLIIASSVLIVKQIQKKNRKRHEKRDLFTEKIEREANEILKQGIAELNDVTIQNEVNKNCLPMYPYCVYILYNLFPNTHPRLFKENKNYQESILRIENYHYDCSDPTSHPLIFNQPIQVIENTVEYSRKLSKLFEDELFVLILFSFLEDDEVVDSKKSDIVSLLSLILMQDMSNYSHILKILIKDDFDKKKENENGKAMFRESDLLSKLLSNWFAILMYDHFLKDNPGGDLLTLYFIILSAINTGPVDFVTNRSQYALNENSLLKGKVNYKKMKINVIYPKELNSPMESGTSTIELDILNCDTIPQVKLKLFEETCKYIPYSQWCKMDDYVLGKRDNTDQFEQEDETEKLLYHKTLKELNRDTNRYYTMNDLGIEEGDTLCLSLKDSGSRSNSMSRCHSFKMESASTSVKTNSFGNLNKINLNAKLSQDDQSKSPHHVLIDSEPNSSQRSKISCCKRKRTDKRSDLYDINSSCLIYTQVLKKRLERYIKLLFDDILDHDLVPHCVKDLFNYFNTICKDDKALFSFKSNSLILRFWVNFITNVDFLFDVPLANNVPVMECLKCISRILMDVCSECQNKDAWLTQVFADIIKEYSPKVIRYYESVNLPEENNNEYYQSIGIDGINISLAIVILYKSYIKPIHDKFIEAIKRSNKPVDRQNKWITILKEVNNLYSPEVFFSNGTGDSKTTVC